MKPNIHPTYYKDAVIKCACGASYLVGSTEKELFVEICSSCHPFYTGKQKLVDTAGRVDKFKARVEAASKAKVKKDAPKVDTASAESGAGAPASKGMRGGIEGETPVKPEPKHKVIKDDKKFDK